MFDKGCGRVQARKNRVGARRRHHRVTRGRHFGTRHRFGGSVSRSSGRSSFHVGEHKCRSHRGHGQRKHSFSERSQRRHPFGRRKHSFRHNRGNQREGPFSHSGHSFSHGNKNGGFSHSEGPFRGGHGGRQCRRSWSLRPIFAAVPLRCNAERGGFCLKQPTSKQGCFLPSTTRGRTRGLIKHTVNAGQDKWIL